MLQTSYIDYASFEKEAEKNAGNENYQSNKCLLPRINICCRSRFLETLKLTGCIKAAGVLLEEGKKLPDFNFRKYVKYLTGTIIK